MGSEDRVRGVGRGDRRSGRSIAAVMDCVQGAIDGRDEWRLKRKMAYGRMVDMIGRQVDR